VLSILIATMAATGYPTPTEIRTARMLLGLSQAQAALMVHSTCRAWQQWEAGDRKMHPAFWELFRIKAVLNARMLKK
jgi:DNA-binding transcriptional regulator YiaG